MKKTLIFTILTLLASLNLLTSCKTGVYATEGGKEDMAYLQVFSSGDMANKTVTVTIDGTTTFQAKVQKMKQSTEKHNGDQYGIRTGQRKVSVTYNGAVIYQKEIFVTSQQTKTIIL